MDYRIHPDIQDPNLTWISCLISFGVMVMLLISYKKYKNTTALIFAFACLFNILGHAFLAASVQLLPNDLPLQIWIANVAAVILFYCIYAYLALVIIYVKFHSISPNYVLFILLIGLFSILPSLLNFEPPTPLASGGYDFHRSFLADFIQFMIGVVLFMGYFSAFASGYRSAKNKLPLTMLASGISIAVIGSPLIAASESPQLAITFHYIVIIGWTLIFFSFIAVGITNRKQTKEDTLYAPPLSDPTN